MKKTPDFDTLAVRAGTLRSQFNEHSEALHLTSSFVFENAADAEKYFTDQAFGYVYSRFSNPTITMMQDRLAALEGAEGCIATASGMSAILTIAMSLLQPGDHIVASGGLFGSTMQLFSKIMTKFGVDTTFVPPTDNEAYRKAVQPKTRLFFVETPSNPLTSVVDIAAVADIAHAAGAKLVVDNSFCTAALQKPMQLGADITVYSATKYLDGQGRVLGGAIVGSKEVTEEVFRFLRTTGACISPFNAWIILKGLETLRIRMDAQSKNALELAQWLERQPNVARVYYPGLPSHPQHALAMRQQQSGGAVVGFDVKGERSAAWRVIDNTRMISITGNLGDTRTTITHPASTTHARITDEERKVAGIGEGLLRVAVGLESQSDIQADLSHGLG